MDEPSSPQRPEIAQTVSQGARGDYVRAARALGRTDVDVVLLQHEFGIFGGRNGEYVLSFARELSPSVVDSDAPRRQATPLPVGLPPADNRATGACGRTRRAVSPRSHPSKRDEARATRARPVQLLPLAAAGKRPWVSESPSAAIPIRDEALVVSRPSKTSPSVEPSANP